MVDMNLALSVLSVAALATAAPHNYTSHFQIFQVSPTDPTPFSTDTATINAHGADTATNSTDDANTAIGFTGGDINSTLDDTDWIDGKNVTTSVGSIFETDDETSVTSGSDDDTSGSTYLTNSGSNIKRGEVSGIDGATSVTEGTSVVINDTADKTDEATETAITDTAAGSVYIVGSKSSAGVVRDVISGSTFSTEGDTSSTESAPSSTDDATSTPDRATSTPDRATSTPDDATSTPDDSTSTPDDATSTPDDAISTPDDATSTPDRATSTPDRATFSRGDDIFAREDVADVADGATLIEGGATLATNSAWNFADEVTEASIGVTAQNDVSSDSDEPSTEVVSETSTVEADERSTDSPFRTQGGVQTMTRSPNGHDSFDDQGNSTKIEDDEVEEPGFGFTFTLPSFFTTILQSVPTIRLSSSNTTILETSPNAQSNGGSGAISNSPNLVGGLANDSTSPLTPFSSSTTTTTLSTLVAETDNSFGLSGTPNTLTTSSSSFDPSNSHASTSGHNVLSTSDLDGQEAPLRVKRSLTENEMRRNREAFAYSGLLSNPDYYNPEYTSVGRDYFDPYDYNYEPHSYPSAGTPEVYEEANQQTGNSGVSTGLFQYIIRTSNLPSVLASFPASSSSSAVHSSSFGNHSSQAGSSTGSHSGAGHVALASQQPSHSSLLPALLSNSSNFNFVFKPHTTPGVDNSFVGSSLAGHQQQSTYTAPGTQGLSGSSHSKPFGSSFASHTSHQQPPSDSTSGKKRPAETHYSTSSEAPAVPEVTEKPFSTRISDSSASVSNSSLATEPPSSGSSEGTTEPFVEAGIVSATKKGIKMKETAEQKVATDRSIRIF